jgi:hypothetical protein
MDTFSIIKNSKSFAGVTAEDKDELEVRYSRTDFFCEGQEFQLESDAKAVNGKTAPKLKNRDLFFGHFNTFF